MKSGRIWCMVGMISMAVTAGAAENTRPASGKRGYFEVERDYLKCLQEVEGPSRGTLRLLHVLHPSQSFGCLLNRSDASRADWTMRELIALGLALDNYNGDCDGYPPPSDIKALIDVIRPYFSPGEAPWMDGWGTPIRYRVTADREWFQLISAGADAVFEKISFPDLAQMEVADGSFVGPEPIVADEFRSDIVYEPTGYSRIPRLYVPEEVGELKKERNHGQQSDRP